VKRLDAIDRLDRFGFHVHADLGFVNSHSRDRAFTRELEAELQRLRAFLGLAS
jgi:hypothetical protein